MVQVTIDLTKEADMVATNLKHIFEVDTKAEAINKLLEASKHLVIKYLEGGETNDRS